MNSLLEMAHKSLRRLILGLMAKIPRTFASRFAVLLMGYTAVILVARFLAFQIRFDFKVPPHLQWDLYYGWLYELPLKLALLYHFGQFGGLLSYFSIPDVKRIFYACTAAFLVLIAVRYLPINLVNVPPRSVVLLDWILCTGGICAVRMALRLLREYYKDGDSLVDQQKRRKAVILGAGDVGATLVKELKVRPSSRLQPVVFLDDDRGKWGCHIHGVQVYGPIQKLAEVKERLGVEVAIFAMPSAPVKKLRELVQLCHRLGLEHYTVPSIYQLATGEVRVSEIRPVDIEDLLGRQCVSIETEGIEQLIRGKVVLVTGAGGSIGSELCRQIVRYAPSLLIMLDHSEYLLFEIQQELESAGFRGLIQPLVGSVLDRARLREIFERYRPVHVFHAAAYKHVPLMELQPAEAIKNNVFGTVYLADMALEYQVERFVLISTDKAINPTSVMGATKRLAEIYLQSLHEQYPQRTKFIAVRFGNVLGSTGSVVTIFKRQIAAGGPVTVTHPEMRRYFMTIPEAVGLVLQSALQGQGGEIFLLEMGEPVKIVDLARQMIELSGLRPGVDIDIVYTGIRPGEKLFEELSYGHESHIPTRHPKIIRLKTQPPSYDLVKSYLEQLGPRVWNGTSADLKEELRRMVPEYQPYRL